MLKIVRKDCKYFTDQIIIKEEEKGNKTGNTRSTLIKLRQLRWCLDGIRTRAEVREVAARNSAGDQWILKWFH